MLEDCAGARKDHQRLNTAQMRARIRRFNQRPGEPAKNDERDEETNTSDRFEDIAVGIALSGACKRADNIGCLPRIDGFGGAFIGLVC